MRPAESEQGEHQNQSMHVGCKILLPVGLFQYIHPPVRSQYERMDAYFADAAGASDSEISTQLQNARPSEFYSADPKKNDGF